MTKDASDQYEQLMAEYKELRRDNSKLKEANAIFDKAIALRQAGKVSDEAIQVGQYY